MRLPGTPAASLRSRSELASTSPRDGLPCEAEESVVERLAPLKYAHDAVCALINADDSIVTCCEAHKGIGGCVENSAASRLRGFKGMCAHGGHAGGGKTVVKQSITAWYGLVIFMLQYDDNKWCPRT